MSHLFPQECHVTNNHKTSAADDSCLFHESAVESPLGAVLPILVGFTCMFWG